DVQLTNARESRNKATKTADTPIGKDEHFAALVGAQAAPTRFNSTLKDDPTINWSGQSTGRRKALAEWITDRRNPLTARVAVNHIWTRHVGTPLVSTMFDFGRKGKPPTDPELVDWLASYFATGGRGD